MNIIIPMAGNGSRFLNAGFNLHKSLIKVASKEMYRYAIDGLPLKQSTKLIFIISKNEFTELLKNNIQHHYFQKYNCSIVVLEDKTEGQAETVLKSAEFLNYEQPTLIHNCDTFVSFSLSELIANHCDGAIVVFNSEEERWSYAKLNNKKNKIIDVQEKKVISQCASTGTYYFRDTALLIQNIKNLIKNQIKQNNEYYLSSVYSLMISDNKNIIPIWCTQMLCFGTPQDLVNSLNYIINKINPETF